LRKIIAIAEMRLRSLLKLKRARIYVRVGVLLSVFMGIGIVLLKLIDIAGLTKNEWSHRIQNLRRPDVVILLTMMRSGSSIVGSVFNERENITYLYEPLFPFGKDKCNENTRKKSLAVLKHISMCQFEHLKPYYQLSKRNDVYAK